MILTGSEIRRQREAGRIKIDPFHADQISPNSYDFRLGRHLEIYEREVWDFRGDNDRIRLEIPDAGIVLESNRIYLAETEELFGSDDFVPMIHAKSSVARMGLFVHVTCDLIEIGSYDRWVLQLHAVHAVRVFPGMLIGQVTFWSVAGSEAAR